jgi:hypothetical protein
MVVGLLALLNWFLLGLEKLVLSFERLGGGVGMVGRLDGLGVGMGLGKILDLRIDLVFWLFVVFRFGVFFGVHFFNHSSFFSFELLLVSNFFLLFFL